MFKILDFTKKNLTAFKAEGKIEKADYDKLTVLFEKNEREYDSQKLYAEIGKLETITPDALWEDFKVYFKHIKNFEKIAIVGDSELVQKIATLSKPFVSGDIKFFEIREASKAKEWIKE